MAPITFKHDMKALPVLSLLALLISSCLTGCVAPMTPQELAQAEATDPLSEEQARKIVLDYIQTNFKDPDLIKDVTVIKPKLEKTSGGRYQWSIPFSVSTTSSCGSYEGGITLYWILYSHGKIISKPALAGLL